LKTRAYNNETRRRKKAALKERIAAVTAELHAARGVTATRYSDIARQAGVSLPTVYSHFPTQDELLQGCTAHVMARAPALPVEKILAATDLPTAAACLVDAMEQQHLHFEPWMAWREDRVIPFLAAMAAEMRQSQAALLANLLASHEVQGTQRELVAAWESVLSFDLWHRLAREHRLPRAAVRRVLVQCLLAVAGPAPASSPTPGPRRTP
jgi:AcrR family transcriptional regulator